MEPDPDFMRSKIFEKRRVNLFSLSGAGKAVAAADAFAATPINMGLTTTSALVHMEFYICE
jgi:hypothetical protein